MQLKTKSRKLQEIWTDLTDIFLNYSSYNGNVERNLNRLNISTVKSNGGHIKCFFWINGKKQCVTISTTPSDRYAGRQILRQFRKIYEKNS